MLKNNADIDIFCNKFLQFIVNKDIEGAFNFIKPATKISENEITKIEIQAMKQFELIGNKYGQWVDYKLIYEKEIENILLKRVYILRTEFLPIKWEFIFYNVTKIINFSYNEEYQELF